MSSIKAGWFSFFVTRPDFSLSTVRALHVRVSRTQIHGAPRALKGLKIVFATDFHARKEMELEPVAAAICAEAPHLVFYGGDLADTKPQAKRVLALMKDIQPEYGSYAVMGNNDAEAFANAYAYRKELDKAGCRLLMNEDCVLSIRGEKIVLSGVAEPYYYQVDWEKTLRQTDGYRICLSHYALCPNVAEACMPDLLLCGHTHGGQFNLLGFTPYSIGFECLAENGKYKPFAVSGWKTIGPTRALVSKGIGMSRIPLRIGVHSEIHSIVL